MRFRRRSDNTLSQSRQIDLPEILKSAPALELLSTLPGFPDLPRVQELLASQVMMQPEVTVAVSPALGTPLGDQLPTVCQFLPPAPLQAGR